MSPSEEPIGNENRFNLIEHVKNSAPFDRFLYAMLLFFIIVIFVGFIGQQLSPPPPPQPKLVPRPGVKGPFIP